MWFELKRVHAAHRRVTGFGAAPADDGSRVFKKSRNQTKFRKSQNTTGRTGCVENPVESARDEGFAIAEIARRQLKLPEAVRK